MEEDIVGLVGLPAEGLMENVPCHQHSLYAIPTYGPCADQPLLWEHWDVVRVRKMSAGW